ncbi:MAG: FecR domain-containing protein [Candidatus Altiarchaeota archaeon]
MKIKKVVLLITWMMVLSTSVQGESVSGEYGSPGDAYLQYSISGADFSGDPDGAPPWVGEFIGEPIRLSGKMIVSRGEGTVSYVTMKASLGDKSVSWPKEGEDSKVEGRTVELPFDLTYTPDPSSESVSGNVRLEVCGGVCGVYNINILVNTPKIVDTPKKVTTTTPTTTTTTLPPCDGSGDSGARFSWISKVVEIFPDSDPDSITSAKTHSVLNVCDHILTGEESSAQITFADLSTLIMREESEIVIAAPPREKGRIEVLAGRLWMNIQKVAAGEQIEVKSNWATVGIKGTTIVVDVDESETTVKVIEGTVEFTSHATGESVEVSSGQMASADSQGLSEVESFIAASEQASWEDIPTGGGGWSWMLLGVGIIIVLAIGGIIGLLVLWFIIRKIRKRKANKKEAADAPASSKKELGAESSSKNKRFCTGCGVELGSDTQFCTECGTKQA